MIADMIESGRVKDITNDIEQYMPDRIKEIYENFPETYYPLTKDGKIYGIACCPVLTEGQVMIIRQDWLDKCRIPCLFSRQIRANLYRAHGARTRTAT